MTRVSTHSGSRSKAFLTLLSLVVLFSAFFKIVDLDFWWHLKTGQIIVTELQIPKEDIYSFTAAGREYIDHEWLFQAIQYTVYGWTGEAGVVLLKCGLIVLTYWITSSFLLQKGASFLFVSSVVFVSILAARVRFIERPEIFTTLFLAILYLCLNRFLENRGKNQLLMIVPILFLIWANIHAAVIIGLLLQLFFIAGCLLERIIARSSYPVFYGVSNRPLLLLMAVFVLSLLATAANPFGFRVLKVPFELTAIIDSGLLNNQEWQQPPVRALPFFYLTLAGVFLVFLVHFRRLHLVNFLFASFLGYISLKYVRNVGLFSMLMPLLIAPYSESLSVRLRSRRQWIATANLGLAAFLIYMIFHSYPYEFGLGASSHFPKRLVDFVQSENLQGNMLNSYAFGGYLIWRLFPERKVFVDGRNEVYLPLLQRIVESRADNRRWNRLLQDYDIEYALLNYVDDLEKVTIVDTTGREVETYAPFSSTHFPRKDWALVYWDDNGMIFIRRRGSNAKLLHREYKSVFPEGKYYQKSLVEAGRIDRTAAISELKRRIQEDPSCRRARFLLETTAESAEMP